ncbi:TPA: hypothetical protein ACMFTJ_001766 [Pseudomonas aeruginosa]
MNKANECTCPSGDGSLVHPCPAHPAVEQAGGDERAAFELFVRKHCGMPAHIAVNWDAKFTNDAWEGWKARAALAQPSPALARGEHAEGEQGEREAKPGLFCRACGGRLAVRGVCSIYCPTCEARAALSQEPAALLYRKSDKGDRAWSVTCDPHYMDFFRKADGYESKLLFDAALAQPYPKCVKCGGTGEADSGGVHPWGEPVLIPCDCETEKAEAERPEVVARVVHSNPVVLGQCGPLNANDELMTVAQHAASVARWAEMFNRVEQQRDAALAEVERLRESKGDPVGSLEKCMKVMYERDEHAKRLEAAQAQHSVPDGASDLCRFLAKLYCELDGLRYSTAKLPAEQIADALIFKWPVLQGARNQLNIKRISEQPYDESKLHSAIAAMLAAAPGKEVPQAWLDVQAERRRQVEAEGWTPEHDDEHADGQMAQAAGCYALHAGGIGTDWPDGRQNGAALFWPWDKDSWKPTTPRRDLVKACALALAEIERLDRAAATQGEPRDA